MLEAHISHDEMLSLKEDITFVYGPWGYVNGPMGFPIPSDSLFQILLNIVPELRRVMPLQWKW